MKRLVLLSALLVLSFAPAKAGDPAGDWLVEDGSAKIRIAICGGSLWGVVGWEKSPGKDSANPDPEKRSRDTLGMPILIDMKPSGPDKWSGQIYNAKDGKMYQASVELQADDGLKVRGCVLGGLFCGGETWSRSADAFPAPIGGGAGKGKAKTKVTGTDAKKVTGTDARAGSSLSGTVCSRVSGVPGASH